MEQIAIGGNVSIGGTLTYEDVTNIDSVEYLTARAGVKVPDSQKIFLGTDNDLQIYHDGSHSYVSDTSTGNLKLTSNGTAVQIEKSDGENMAIFRTDGSVELFDNSREFETTTTGATVTGTLTASGTGAGSTALGSHLDLGDNQKVRLGADDDLEIYHDGNNSAINDKGTGKLYIQGSSNIYIRDYDTSESHIIMTKNGSVELYHDGSRRI